MGNERATVINIVSAKRDAELLKMLLSKACEKQNKPSWLFIPTGLHLITTPELVKTALRTQNKYCSELTAIIIEGITRKAMLSGGENSISIFHDIRNRFNGLVSIESTMFTESRGRWILIVKKTNETEIRNYVLQNIIPSLDNAAHMTYEGVAVGIAGSLIGPTTVGSYAEVLKRQLNSDSSANTSTPSTYSTRGNKRRSIIPVHSNATNTTVTNTSATTDTERRTSVHVPTARTSSQASSSLTDTTEPNLQQRLSALEKKLEDDLQEKLTKFEQLQQTRFDDFEKMMSTKIQTMIESINEKFHQRVQTQITQVHQTLTQNMSQMQSEIITQIRAMQMPPSMQAMAGHPPAPHSTYVHTGAVQAHNSPVHTYPPLVSMAPSSQGGAQS